jgi:CRP-like cAMP-binding protein
MLPKSFLPVLETLPLFYKIKPDDILTLLECMGASVRTYKKGEYLLTEGQDMTGLLILLKGHALLYKNADTSPSLLGAAHEGYVLGAASIGRETVPCLMAAMASVPCTALSIPYRRLMFQCTLRCPFHHQILENLVISISEGQRQLYEKIYILSQKTIREKLLAFLSGWAGAEPSGMIVLPFGRTELANYLCADRSALTRELNAMQREGILTFCGNEYTLLSPDKPCKTAPDSCYGSSRHRAGEQ